MSARTLTADQIEAVKGLKAGGWSYARIADKFGVNHMTIRRICDRLYAEQMQNRRRDQSPASMRHTVGAAAEKTAALLAEIPVDTRTPAQRLLGDPIPQRSALWAKREESSA